MENSQEKYFAFLVYLLSLVGVIYVLFFRPTQERFAQYHARQSLGIQIIALGLLLAWFIVIWVLAWIPYIGFIVGIALFALVLAAYIVLAISYMRGMINALQLKRQPVPIVGNYATSLSSFLLEKVGYRSEG
ncbi:hypothetical protein CSA56_12130 [candidate division KSB3 bacterium]|uniref:DUF4870 domain-containing protein n=1 Tax=candidate division KSB3 bacterium TaxID=2044937 RepID=A0A2G6KCA9_9BACT|nr:MAG: hypothetical protein CSA56_12130 [candidate division KSB3 bacterium]